jgi:hypothetical protein
VNTPHWPTRRSGFGAPAVDAATATKLAASAQTASATTQQAIAAAQEAVSIGGSIDLNGLVAYAGLAADTVTAIGQQAVSQMSAGLQAQWANATSPAANSSRIAGGIEAGSDLIVNGYNPDSAGDNQKLIVSIAGGVSLIPGVGPILGGAVLLLDAGAQAIAKVLEDAGIIWFGCRTTGNWTVQTVLSENPIPPMPPGSFAALAVPMLAQDCANTANCKGSLGMLAVLAGAASIWNAGASGPPMTVYVPSFGSVGGLFVESTQAAVAFQPAKTTTELTPFGNFDGNNGFSRGTTPFILQLNGSTFTRPSATQAAISLRLPGSAGAPMSTPTKVAIGAAVVGGAGLLAVGGYAAAKHMSIKAVLKGLVRR